jgi:hypothetical protein
MNPLATENLQGATLPQKGTADSAIVLQRNHRSTQEPSEHSNEALTVAKNQKYFSKDSLRPLRAWLLDNLMEPYPRDPDIRLLSEQSGLTPRQVKSWFTNTRKVRTNEKFRKKVP